MDTEQAKAKLHEGIEILEKHLIPLFMPENYSGRQIDLEDDLQIHNNDRGSVRKWFNVIDALAGEITDTPRLLELKKQLNALHESMELDIVYPNKHQDILRRMAGVLRDILAEDKSDAASNKPPLPPAEEKAYHSYCIATKANPDLADEKDEVVYEWLKENGSQDYDLPVLETWKRQLRSGRKHYGTNKNTKRAGRSGRSVFKQSQITPDELSAMTSKFDDLKKA